MSMKRTDIEIEIEFIEPIYGSLPGDKEIYEKFIASKAPDAPSRSEKLKEEIDAIGLNEALEKGMTGFARNRDGDPILMSYVVKGFFKAAANATNLCVAKTSKDYLTQYKAKIDKLIFVTPTGDLNAKDAGLILEVPEDRADEALEIAQRPLRAETAQGPRTALASSETLPEGTRLVCIVSILGDMLVDYIPTWLNYGKYNGIGQWRNSGKGRFRWKELNRTVRDEG